MADFHRFKVSALVKDGQINKASALVLDEMARLADDEGRVMQPVDEIVRGVKGLSLTEKFFQIGLLKQKGLITVELKKKPKPGSHPLFYRLSFGIDGPVIKHVAERTVMAKNAMLVSALTEALAALNRNEVPDAISILSHALKNSKLRTGPKPHVNQTEYQKDDGEPGGEVRPGEGDSQNTGGRTPDVSGVRAQEQAFA